MARFLFLEDALSQGGWVVFSLCLQRLVSLGRCLADGCAGVEKDEEGGGVRWEEGNDTATDVIGSNRGVCGQRNLPDLHTGTA